MYSNCHSCPLLCCFFSHPHLLNHKECRSFNKYAKNWESLGESINKSSTPILLQRPAAAGYPYLTLKTRFIGNSKVMERGTREGRTWRVDKVMCPEGEEERRLACCPDNKVKKPFSKRRFPVRPSVPFFAYGPVHQKMWISLHLYISSFRCTDMCSKAAALVDDLPLGET